MAFNIRLPCFCYINVALFISVYLRYVHTNFIYLIIPTLGTTLYFYLYVHVSAVGSSVKWCFVASLCLKSRVRYHKN